MKKSKCEESDGVRKVRLRTTSGVLTLCYRGLQSSSEVDNSPDASSVEKVSQGGSQLSGVSKESGFESLPELFEFADKLSAGEGSNGYSNSVLDLPPDFSTYNFWASESGHTLPYTVNLSDTFSPCDLAGMMDHAAPGLEPIVDDAHGPGALQKCATKPGPHFENSALNSSPMIGEINTLKRKSYWDFPLELEEDFFESASYGNLLKDVTDERDIDGASVVDDFLVDRSPEFSDDVADVENLDSNLLVYAPNRYLEDACIFQSPPADSELDVETLRTIPVDRIHDSQKCSRQKRGSVREQCLKGGKSMDTESRNSDTPASVIEESDVQCGAAKNLMSQSSGDRAHVLRMFNCVNHRRRRFSALGVNRSKFLKHTTLISLAKRSPNPVRREMKSGRRVRSPIRESETTRRLFKLASSSDLDSDSQSAGESRHNGDNSPLGTKPRELSLPFDNGKTHHVSHTAEVSQGKSASSPDILNKTSNREAPTLKLSPNQCLLRKKRTRYADMFHGPDNSNKFGTRLSTESLSQDSPKKSKRSKESTQDSPAISQFRSPKVSRKKVRTSRRRPLKGSPTSAKKFHCYGNFIYEGSSQVAQGTPSPEREGQSQTKPAERKGRRRLPLPTSSVDILQGWLHENLSDPYPSRQEKEDLVYQTGLKMSQIDNWLGNARQKLKSRVVKDLCCSESTSSREQPKKQSKRKRSYFLKRL